MSGVTPNYGLILPEAGEPYDLAITNSNNTAIDAQIKNRQTRSEKILHAEFTAPSTTYAANGSHWGPGGFTVDAGATFNNSFVAADTGDHLKFLESGTYIIQFMLFGGNLPPSGEQTISNVTTNVIITADDLGKSVSWLSSVTATVYVAANQRVTFYTVNRTGAYSSSARVRVTKIQGT